MKKINSLFLLISILSILSACNNKNDKPYEPSETTSSSVTGDKEKISIKLEKSQFEAKPGDKIYYQGTTEPNAEIGLGDDFNHKTDDDGNFKFEYIVPDLNTEGITNPVNVRKDGRNGMHGSYIKVLEKDEIKREVVPEENLKALSKANEYNNSMPLSKRELFSQLTDYEKFTEEQAQYAVDNITADWKENALKSAKIYKNDMNMSNEEIKGQLTSDAGNKYTEEEANYAIENLK